MCESVLELLVKILKHICENYHIEWNQSALWKQFFCDHCKLLSSNYSVIFVLSWNCCRNMATYTVSVTSYCGFTIVECVRMCINTLWWVLCPCWCTFTLDDTVLVLSPVRCWGCRKYLLGRPYILARCR